MIFEWIKPSWLGRNELYELMPFRKEIKRRNGRIPFTFVHGMISQAEDSTAEHNNKDELIH